MAPLMQALSVALSSPMTFLLQVSQFALSMQVAPLAAAFVGYVVFWNLSLQVNSVGFYQLSKIMVLPTVAALEVNIHLTCVMSLSFYARLSHLR